MSPGTPRLTLTGQVLGLVLLAVILAQAVTVVAVVLMPPTGPPRYDVTEVAAVLRGDTIETDSRRPLRRREVRDLPAEFGAVGQDGASATEMRLAALLDAPVETLRFHHRGPPRVVELTSGGGPGQSGAPREDRPPPGPGPGPPQPHGPPPEGFVGGPPRGPGGPMRGDPQTLDEFAAAWRQPDGVWIVVSPSPETEWLRRVAFWLGAGLLVTAPLGYAFARRLAAPIRGFAESAERLGRDPQAPMIAPDGPAEVGVAARAFNEMQQRIRRFVSDRVGMVGAISHDLRTPLTRIRFKLEKASPEVRAAILTDVEQMEQMISGVLAFVRDGLDPTPRERLDLASLVACAVDDAALTGADASMDLDEALIVDGHPVSLQRLFANLIDNAVKYGGVARVRVGREGEVALVVVADDGPGLAADDLEQVFAPFFRTEQARTSAMGAGLGLSVARSIARAHGGDITLKAPGRGLVVEVRLPLAPA